jgi:hypothetical protein
MTTDPDQKTYDRIVNAGWCTFFFILGMITLATVLYFRGPISPKESDKPEPHRTDIYPSFFGRVSKEGLYGTINMRCDKIVLTENAGQTEYNVQLMSDEPPRSYLTIDCPDRQSVAQFTINKTYRVTFRVQDAPHP